MTDAPSTPSPAPRPPVIGLAGGIGAGKSEAARALARLGCLVLHSDDTAKALLDRDDVRARLVEWWGGAVLDASGRIDRAALARTIFADAGARQRLERLVHPLVTAEHERRIAEAARGWTPARARTGAAPRAVVLDSPLLFEAGLNRRCDAVIFVEAPRELRLTRVRDSRGWDDAELSRRENSQMPLEKKRSAADYVVVNDAGPDDLSRRLRDVLDALESQQSRQG